MDLISNPIIGAALLVLGLVAAWRWTKIRYDASVAENTKKLHLLVAGLGVAGGAFVLWRAYSAGKLFGGGKSSYSSYSPSSYRPAYSAPAAAPAAGGDDF